MIPDDWAPGRPLVWVPWTYEADPKPPVTPQPLTPRARARARAQESAAVREAYEAQRISR